EGDEREEHRGREEHAFDRAKPGRVEREEGRDERRLAERAHRARLPQDREEQEHAVPDEREGARRDRRDAPPRPEVPAPPHGNLRTTSARTSASAAKRSTPGTRRNGKSSSIVAACDSNFVFSSRSRILCMLSSRPFLSVATKDSPSVSCAILRRS